MFSFQPPSPRELQHEFLWRATRDLPERRHIGLFNRSYHAKVLSVRVRRAMLHSEAILQPDGDASVWLDRLRSILDLERHRNTPWAAAFAQSRQNTQPMAR